MNRARWKDVERKVAAKLNEVLSDVGDLSPIERIPLLGREGPDLTVNELGLVINVKSRGRIPDRLFPRAGESMFIGGGLSVFRLEELAHTVNMLPYTATKSWKQLADWWIWMDKWTQQFQPAGITCIVIHQPRMPIGHAGVVLQTKDLRRLSCQIQQIQSN